MYVTSLKVVIVEAKETFSPFVYVCQSCHQQIFSRFSGEFVQCECGKSYVDQTKYYIRVGGNAKPVTE